MKISVVNIFCSIPALFCLGLDLRAIAASDSGIQVADGKPDYAALFRNLAEDFNSHELGCPDLFGPVDVYTWRPPGYGSNINNMILPWVHALVLGRRDLALVLTKGNKIGRPGVFDLVDCVMESNGAEAVSGFSCLFAAMPHLCTFQTNKDWESFMIERNVSTAAREDALSRQDVRSDQAMIPEIKQHLQDSNMDLISTMAVVLDYLHSHWQPWLKRDIQSMLDEPTTAAVREVPYISMHVRRGDKLKREAKAHDVKEYLEAASSYIQNSTEATVSIEDIRGIWISSDDESVVPDVKQTFAEFFPNVQLERVVWISNCSLTTNFEAPGDAVDAVPTKTKTMHYRSYVVFFAELTSMAEGNVFVGTFTSNVGRMMVLLRETKGLPRSSTISIEPPTWFPGRRALLTG